MTDIAGQLQMGLVTDPVIKENLQLALTQGLGISGFVRFQSTGGGAARTIDVPLDLKLADPHSFGTRLFDRERPLRNPSPYAMKLKYLHVLVAENPLHAYTYDLKNTVLRAGEAAKIRGIPEWLDRAPQVLKMWVDYALVPDEAATNAVLEAITGGVVGVARAEITFRTLTYAQELKVASVLVKVSSRYFDTKGTEEVVKTVELDKESSAYKVGPIFLIKRQPGEAKPGDPLFRYRITVVLDDGSMKGSKEWIEGNDLTVFIGKAQLKPVVEQ
jgi:hypothetical protein